MKIDIPKKWCAEKAREEGDETIGVGFETCPRPQLDGDREALETFEVYLHRHITDDLVRKNLLGMYRQALQQQSVDVDALKNSVCKVFMKQYKLDGREMPARSAKQTIKWVVGFLADYGYLHPPLEKVEGYEAISKLKAERDRYREALEKLKGTIPCNKEFSADCAGCNSEDIITKALGGNDE